MPVSHMYVSEADLPRSCMSAALMSASWRRMEARRASSACLRKERGSVAPVAKYARWRATI